MAHLSLRAAPRNLQRLSSHDFFPVVQNVTAKLFHRFRQLPVSFRFSVKFLKYRIRLLPIIDFEGFVKPHPQVLLRKPCANLSQVFLQMESIQHMLRLRKIVKPPLNPTSAVSMHIDFFYRFYVVRLLDVSFNFLPQRLAIKMLIHKMHRANRPISLSDCFVSLCHRHKRNDFSLLAGLLPRSLHVHMILVRVHVQRLHRFLSIPLRFLFKIRKLQNMIPDALPADRSVSHNFGTFSIGHLCSLCDQLRTDRIADSFIFANAQDIVKKAYIAAVLIVIVVIPLQMQHAEFCEQGTLPVLFLQRKAPLPSFCLIFSDFLIQFIDNRLKNAAGGSLAFSQHVRGERVEIRNIFKCHFRNFFYQFQCDL